jgi:hypothetical protein
LLIVTSALALTGNVFADPFRQHRRLIVGQIVDESDVETIVPCPQ